MTPARPLPVFILAETLSGRTRGPANRRGEIRVAAPRGRSATGGPQRRPDVSAGRWLPGGELEAGASPPETVR